MPDSKSFTFIETKDYTIRLEYSKDYVILHMPYVAKLTKGVFLDMKYRLEDFHQFVTTAGYAGLFAAIDPNDSKMIRFLQMQGFKYKGTADNMYVYFYGEV